MSTVLVVEDDADVSDATCLALASFGHEVLTARDGVEGLDLLHGFPRPDVVLLDLGLPDLDGWGFLKAARLDGDVRGVPVVVITGNKVAAARENELATGVPILQKPIDLSVLLDAIAAASAGDDLSYLELGKNRRRKNRARDSYEDVNEID